MEERRKEERKERKKKVKFLLCHLKSSL
jgi:hypothetical protein